MSLNIHLFGPFRVFVDGVQIDDQSWGRRKSKTLVKLLALQPARQSSRQMHREELIELLWPEVDSEQGLNNLHKALHAARRALEPGLSAGTPSRFLSMRDQLVMLQSAEEICVDVFEFETRANEALKTGRRDLIEAALSLCQGDLLPEDLYEDWLAVRREQLRSRKEQLLLSLAAVCEGSGDSGAALDACRQLLASNPCNEAAHRCLMRLYSGAGQRYLAVEQFRTCTETLRRELDADPEPETAALYDRILSGARQSHGGTAVAPALAREPIPSPGPGRSPRFRYLAGAALLVCIGLICTGAIAVFLARTSPVQFVAIMPLTTAADSPELDYLADGITESVIDNLSRLRQVRVMARSTVYRYRAKGLDPMAAAAQMKVHSVLTGTISKRGRNLLVAAELVAVPEGTRIWGNQYELTAKDLTSVQDRIASEIAASLRLRLSGDDRARLSHTHQTDPEAYRLYLQARFFWNQRSKDGYLRSIELFQAALARDPAYAPAYAGLADSYSFLGRDEAPTHEYMRKAKAAAERALAIDDNLAEAHASLAMMTNVYEWNFPAAERRFRRALELDPGYANGHLFYGVFLASQGEFKEAQSQLDQAAELDPLSPIIALCRGYPAGFQGQVEPAIGAARKALDISPGFPAAFEDLMNYFEMQGRRDEAMRQAVALLYARGQHDLAESVQAAFRQSGYQAALRLWFDAEEGRAAREYVSPLRIALLAIRMGDRDKAFYWLDKAVEDRNAGLVYLNVDPKYSTIRSDPRFGRLIQRVGLRGPG
jgi:DNA-binding SARP family transcriptional activator/TolB-like protein